jgi:hypothetical protein
MSLPNYFHDFKAKYGPNFGTLLIENGDKRAIPASI